MAAARLRWRNGGVAHLARFVAAAVCAGALITAGCADDRGPATLAGAPSEWRHDTVRAMAPADELGGADLREVLGSRRSERELSADPLSDSQLATLLWSAQGVSAPTGARTSPSAGALYPLELYAVTPQEVLRYLPGDSSVQVRTDGTAKQRLASAMGGARASQAYAIIAVAGVAARSTGKYGERGVRYMWMEAGHATQNLLLAATAMGLGAVPIGAFDDEAVSLSLGLPEGQTPLYLIPVGHPAG